MKHLDKINEEPAKKKRLLGVGLTYSDSNSETDCVNKEHEKELRKYKDERKLSSDGDPYE